MFGAVALLEYIARVVVALQNYAALGEEPQRILSAYKGLDNGVVAGGLLINRGMHVL